jgi:hypothetical protein
MKPLVIVFILLLCISCGGSNGSNEASGGSPGDTTAPTTPQNLNATTISASKINLTWAFPSDFDNVAGYRIYRDGALLATATTTVYSDTGLIASTLYSYTISAYDAAGNESGHCGPASATTMAPSETRDATISASRTHGVAPLTVFFDATGTTGLADDGFFSDNAAYMDATFAWSFDADNHDPDGQYERTSGFVAAHVFERPGTYRVHLDVYDATGELASQDITITVAEFSGATYYVADDGSDSNTGLTMDDPLRTPEYALSSEILDTNVRVLFKNGDTFTIRDMIAISDQTGPILIGAYSDPDQPSPAKPIIHTTDVNASWATIYFWNCSDVRIMDLAARATAESSEDPRYPFGIGWGSDCSHMLKYRTEEYQNGGMSMSPSGTFSTVAECVFHHTTQTGYTSTGEGANDGNALIGNWVHDKNTVDPQNEEHVFRLQGGSRYFIGHNTFGPNLRVNYDAMTIRGNSEKIVVYKNYMEGWVQAFWPQNRNSAEEYQHHCIMDSNLIVGQGLYENDRQTAIALHAKDIVVRNNIIYDYENGVGIGDDTAVGPSQRIKIYNNTFINPTVGSTFHVIGVDAPCSAILIENNVMLDIAGGNSLFLDIREGTTFNGQSDHNLFYGNSWSNPALFDGSTLANWQSSTGNDQNSAIHDPEMVSTDDEDLNFCMPRAGSELIDNGAFTPAALDYHGNLRDLSRDVGACEFFQNPS